jgi:O-antigen ligase
VSRTRRVLRDRVQFNSILIVLSFVSVLVLNSQSAASYATYLLALSMLLTIREWRSVFEVPMAWLIFALLAYLFLSSFWSDPYRARDAFSIFIRVLLIFLFVVAFAECLQRRRMRLWLGRGLMLIGIIAVLASLMIFHATDPEDGRLAGLGQLRTHVIAALVFGVVLIFVLDQAMSDGPWPWRAFAVASAVVIAYAIVLSDSRNAWFSVSIGAGVFVLARNIHDQRIFVMSVVALLTLVALGVVGLAANESTRALVLPREDSFRLVIWAETLAAIGAHGPWFGAGINTDTVVVINGLEFLHPHSLYLAVAYQGGVIGLGLFLVLLAGVSVTLVRHYQEHEAKLALGILALALPAYLLDGYQLVDKVGSTWFLLWLPVGISLGYAWVRAPRSALRESA